MPFSSNVQADGLFSDCVNEGEAFQLLDVRDGGTRNTEYGEAETTQLLIPTPSGDQWLSVIGKAIKNEAKGLTNEDLPAWCVIERQTTKKGNPVKILRPAVQGQDPRADVRDPASANASTAPAGGYGNVSKQDPGKDDTPF